MNKFFIDRPPMTPGKYRPIMVGQEKGRNHMKISLPGMEMGQQAKKGVEREMHGEQAILPLTKYLK